MDNAIDETDLYELGIRRKSSRVNILVGLLLVVTGIALFLCVVVWAILAANADESRAPSRAFIVLVCCGGATLFGGVGALVNGMRARRAMMAFEAELRARDRAPKVGPAYR